MSTNTSAAPKEVFSDAKNQQSNKQSESDLVRETQADHLFIALCGPIGTGLKHAACILKDSISTYGYNTEVLKLSNFIKMYGSINEGESPYKLANDLMTQGNRLRTSYGDPVLATLAISKIQEWRANSGGEKISGRDIKKCFIIDSIKNDAELELFRLIYRESFFLVGVFSEEQTRLQSIIQKGMAENEARALINRDYSESTAHGQSVKDVFFQSDYFVNYRSNDQLKNALNRFISLIIGHNIVTPDVHERSMHAAWSASVNSACLSRQVGAAISAKDGTIISTGWNDVPKYGGGLYTSDISQDKDARCFACSDADCRNTKEKDRIIEDILHGLNTYIKDGKIENVKTILKSSKIKSLIEFSRAVHAEMHALIEGGRLNGLLIQGATLYCTTYPCHNCARHLVAAGIDKVYYIEPYAKSRASSLHFDAIDHESTTIGKMHIIPYEGVGPTCFMKLFTSSGYDRKIGLSSESRTLRGNKLKISQQSIFALEELVISKIRPLVNPEPSTIPVHEPAPSQTDPA